MTPNPPFFDRTKYPIGPLTIKDLRHVLGMYPDDLPVWFCGEAYVGLCFALSLKKADLEGLSA